jgi:2'-deoxynucleoside 5'-phosphate N-hydrolase
MKIYLSVPMIANRAIDRANLMAKAIRDSGHEMTSPWVLGPLERSNPGDLNIFERDREGVERSDAIVADVTDPSIGVGMEIMAAHKTGKKVVVVAKKGKVTSGMLLHMQPKETVEYDDESEIYDKLCSILRKTR